MNLHEVYFAAQAAENSIKSRKYRLIEHITLDEAASIIERNSTPEGEPYNFEKVIVYVHALAGTAATVTVYINGASTGGVSKGVNTSAAYWCKFAAIENGILQVFNTATSTNNTSAVAVQAVPTLRFADAITSIKLTVGSSASFPAGSEIKIYGLK